jgi:hypothetical protein
MNKNTTNCIIIRLRKTKTTKATQGQQQVLEVKVLQQLSLSFSKAATTPYFKKTNKNLKHALKIKTN